MDEFFQQLWAAAEKAGPFATMITLFMWYVAMKDRDKEREERKAVQKEYNLLQEKTLTTAATLTEAVKEAMRLVRNPNA